MHYRSFSDLETSCNLLLEKLPDCFDFVVGIPRSGLVPGLFIALARNIPFFTLDEFSARTGPGHGTTRPVRRVSMAAGPKRALVVDDTVGSGRSMNAAAEKLLQADLPNVTYEFCAIYVTPERESNVDYFAETITYPRVFQWNLFHNPLVSQFGSDLDGVFCRDPTDSENDDGRRYVEFISSVPARRKVTQKLAFLGSNRLQKYRTSSEEWLRRNNIAFEKSFFLPFNTPDERRRLINYGEFKAKWAKAERVMLFIESDVRQAMFIAKEASIPVICTDANTLIEPDLTSMSSINWHLEKLRRRSSGTVKGRLRQVIRAARRKVSIVGG